MRFVSVAAAASALALAPAAMAAPTIVTVDAQANSSVGGTGALVTGLTFAAGQQFSISSSVDDLWSSGALPRFSDADGIVPRFATASDDSGQPVGTQIGANFVNFTLGNLTARYGSLVAVTGVNSYQLLGANGIFISSGGPLDLVYWDENADDNAGSITFSISAVPEASTWAMMILGMGFVGAAMRVRRHDGSVVAA